MKPGDRVVLVRPDKHTRGLGYVVGQVFEVADVVPLGLTLTDNPSTTLVRAYHPEVRAALVSFYPREVEVLP